MRRFLTPSVLLLCLALLPAPVWAQGHMLHGYGPINSSMGGAGTGLPEDSLNALTHNPALLSAADPGNQISFSTEFFNTGIEIDVNAFGRTGHAISTDALGIIPAFGWMSRDPNKKMAIGFGLIGVAGFGTDYPEQPNSIIFEKPSLGHGGFGRIFTDYNVTNIPAGFSFQATPKLSIGATLNVYRANLAISPLPYLDYNISATATPASPAGIKYYLEGSKMAGRFSVGTTIGFYYKQSEMMGIGASITTPQNYKPFQWNSFVADPTSAQFGNAKELHYDLDGPLMLQMGTGIKPNKKTSIAVDVTWTRYDDVNGFGSPGGVINGEVNPFGWRNIWAFKSGVRYQATPTVDVRAGYTFSQMPLQSAKVLTATGAPATFQNHITGGVGFKMFPFLTMEGSAYFVPRESLTGPFLVDQVLAGNPNPDPNKGGRMTTSNTLYGLLVGFNFHF